MAETLLFEDMVARNIRTRREALGLTQLELCKRLGIGTGQVYGWESGLHLPGAWSLCLLADEFECTVDELLGRGGKDGD